MAEINSEIKLPKLKKVKKRGYKWLKLILKLNYLN